MIVVSPGPAALAQTTEQLFHSYVGQKLILRGLGAKAKAKIKREEILKKRGGCDKAVEVREADLFGDELRLRLEYIGVPSIPGMKTHSCSAPPVETLLTVSGIGTQEPPSAVSKMLARILQTPEDYLTSYGVKFNPEPGPTTAPMVELMDSSKPPPGISNVRPLLIVNAPYSEDARQQHVQGVVKVAIEVGTNGIVQRSRVLKGVEPSLDQQVVRVLPLFRFEPGSKDGQVAIVRTVLEMQFRMF